MATEIRTTEIETCDQCCGTGWMHPDDPAGRCSKCNGTGGIPSEVCRQASDKTSRQQSREERTLRVLFMIARRLYDVTLDAQDWQHVVEVERLINDCAAEEVAHAR